MKRRRQSWRKRGRRSEEVNTSGAAVRIGRRSEEEQ